MAPPGATVADVLVVFGITGNLAKVMALHSLFKRDRGVRRRQRRSYPVMDVGISPGW